MSTPLPALAGIVPAAGAVLAYGAGRRSGRLRNAVVFTTAAAAFVLCGWLNSIVRREGVAVHRISWALGEGLTFRVDAFGAQLALLVALVWLLVTAFSFRYMAHEHAPNRFYFMYLLTFTGCLGVFLAGDLFTLYLFFEVMTFAAYPLVVHEESPEALQAGWFYLYLSVAGGLLILLGTFLLRHFLGTTAWKPAADRLREAGVSPYLLFALFCAGFGVKAGMLPLHVWLPRAHPVAPSPASAVLSGLMIKAGAYGIARSAVVLLHSGSGGAGHGAGVFLLWVGAATMFGGAVMAILAPELKKILAYSSVSQMGYILFGLGGAAFLGPRGGLAFGAAWLHMINHALFKSTLFLVAGAVIQHTGRKRLSELGGVARELPLAFAAFLVAAGGLTGLPGFNGYVSKTLLHHAILEVAGHGGGTAALFLEKVFVLTSGLTVVYALRLLCQVFLGRNPQPRGAESVSAGQGLALGGLALLVAAIGLAPGPVLAGLILPAAKGLHFDPHVLEHLAHLNVFTLHDLEGPLIALGIGAALYLLAGRRPAGVAPPWLSVEELVYRPLVALGRRTAELACALELAEPASRAAAWAVGDRRVARQVPMEGWGERWEARLVETWREAQTGSSRWVSARLEAGRATGLAALLRLQTARAALGLPFHRAWLYLVTPAAHRTSPEWQEANLGFDLLLLAVTLMALLVGMFYLVRAVW